jgi:D-3-phosphoglycerate dehydrogenase / 2-oxoglutarate reductase
LTGDLIFVALSTFAERDRRPLDLLEGSSRPFRIHATGKRITPPELIRDGADAAVVIAGVEPYEAPTLDRLPSLRCIMRCGVGVDAVDLAAAKQRGIAVMNTPDAPTAAVAELALTMFLALSRNIRPQANSMARREWTRVEAHLLTGRTVGLVGLGRIGRRVAELTHAFGARILATDPLADPVIARSVSTDLVPLERLLEQSDIVSLHASRAVDAPLALGDAELARMKRGALIVNLARGGMVDETALVNALRCGHLAGAALDVFTREPYTGPLSEFDNVILTPHSATNTVETRASMELECVEKALRFLEGRIHPEERVA